MASRPGATSTLWPLGRHTRVCCLKTARLHAGVNNNGQLGANLAERQYQKLAAGGRHTCGISEGDVLCWGDNRRGQATGVSGSGSDIPNAVLMGDTGATDICAGEAFTCAITASADGENDPSGKSLGGQVVCWGDNLRRQVTVEDVPWSGPSVRDDVTGALSLACGDRFACAVVRDGANGGDVYCWGDNGRGQLGRNGSGIQSLAQQVPGLTSVDQVVAGDDHTCALTYDGDVLCWGRADRGQTGPVAAVTTIADYIPNPVELGGPVVALAAGSQHTCALRNDNKVLCWGARRYGQSGGGNTTAYTCPHKVDLSGQIPLSVAAGLEHTCVLTAGGGVACWGAGNLGQLGTIDRRDRSTPLAVPGLSDVDHIVAGGNGTCARVRDNIREANVLFCWGENRDGQLTPGGDSVQRSPLPLMTETTVDNFALGARHACWVGEGQVYCQGHNGQGQLGAFVEVPGDTIPDQEIIRPVVVQGVGPTTAVVVNDGYTCALETDGKVTCWGRVPAGILNRTDDEKSSSTGLSVVPPSRVPGWERVVGLYAGPDQLCAWVERVQGGVLSCRGRGH